MDIPVYENDRAYIKRTLYYPADFSDSSKAGKVIPKTDTTKIVFNVRDNVTDDTTIIDLSDAVSTEIEWLDEVNGVILVKLGTNTNGHAGTKYYALRMQLADASWVTLEIGRLKITNLADVS